MAGLGGVGPGKARHGWAGCGKAWVTDGGTEGFGPLCHPHRGGRGVIWRGRLGLG